MCLLFSDNIFEHNVKEQIALFDETPNGAKVFLTESENPEWYGVAELKDDGEVAKITEKPAIPQSNLIVTGLYLYDRSVWDYIEKLEASDRVEL